MTEHNPAYKDPNYVPFPTPIPEGLASYTPPETKTPRRDASEPRKPTVTLSLKNRKSSVAADSPSATEPAIGTPVPSGDFAGRSFQQAQEQIVNELLTYTEDTESVTSFLNLIISATTDHILSLLIYGPFINLPSRSLTEYYKTIKKPMSLSAIKKKVTGKHGREDPTGVSDFKSWDNFEDEVSLIWNNAKLFNEDGSEIFVLAEDFEQHFKERLALAKEQVEGPQQPKITLKSRPKPVLHLGSKGSPAPAATSGVTIDTEALARQKQAVQTGLNGHANAAEQRPSLPHSRSESLIPGATPVKAPSPSLIPASVKAEKSGVPSPALANARLPSTAPEAARPATATSMLPPAARIASGSPRPAAAAHAPFQTPQIPSFVPAPTTFLDNFTRKTPVADALLPNVSITSHPQLPLPKPFKLDVAPSSSYTHQSLTVSLAPSHYWVQIAPTVSQQLLLSKQYKLFVTVNGVRLMATNRGYVNGEMNGSATTRQVYDAQLLPGVNRIEVEIAAVNAAATAAAGAAKIVHGANGVSGGSETEKAAEKTTRVPLETEKVTVFANLLRNL